MTIFFIAMGSYLTDPSSLSSVSHCWWQKGRLTEIDTEFHKKFYVAHVIGGYIITCKYGSSRY